MSSVTAIRRSWRRGAMAVAAATLMTGLGGPAGPAAVGALDWPIVRQGDTGENVRSIELMLRHRGYHGFTVDTDFGPNTTDAVKLFQRRNGLSDTGVVNGPTWGHLIVVTRNGSNGAAVRALQFQLNQQGENLTVDGDFGPRTEAAVDHYKGRRCLQMDGVAGGAMWRELVNNTAASSGCFGTLPRPSFGPSIEGLANYDGQDTCDPVAKPGVIGFRSIVLNAFPTTHDSGIIRNCDVGPQSEHKEGRAWDWGGLNASDPADQERVGTVMRWLFAEDQHGNNRARLRRLGIMYIIWDRQIWKAYEPGQGWQPYTGTNPHTGHVHFSFSWPGARKNTTWWNPEDSYPSCWPRCQ